MNLSSPISVLMVSSVTMLIGDCFFPVTHRPGQYVGPKRRKMEKDYASYEIRKFKRLFQQIKIKRNRDRNFSLIN